jgi:hypothetical protein
MDSAELADDLGQHRRTRASEQSIAVRQDRFRRGHTGRTADMKAFLILEAIRRTSRPQEGNDDSAYN